MTESASASRETPALCGRDALFAALILGTAYTTAGRAPGRAEAADIDGVALCRMLNQAMSGKPLPKHLSTDHDPLFRFHRWRANLRVLEIEEIKTVPFVPCSHPFIERLIGTIRREYLDHVLFWNRLDLQRKLGQFACYYNHVRVHSALSGTTPADRGDRASPRLTDLLRFSWQAHCHGLFHTPVAA